MNAGADGVKTGAEVFTEGLNSLVGGFKEVGLKLDPVALREDPDEGVKGAAEDPPGLKVGVSFFSVSDFVVVGLAGASAGA